MIEVFLALTLVGYVGKVVADRLSDKATELERVRVKTRAEMKRFLTRANRQDF